MVPIAIHEFCEYIFVICLFKLFVVLLNMLNIHHGCCDICPLTVVSMELARPALSCLCGNIVFLVLMGLHSVWYQKIGFMIA